MHADPALKCCMCKMSFLQAKDRRKHEREAHSKDLGGGSIKCECGKIYSTTKFRDHFNKIHRGLVDGVKIIKCKTCQQIFNSRKDLAKHRLENHTLMQPCEVCGVLVSEGSYRHHIRTTHTTHKCDVEGCGLEFPRLKLLSYHKTHSHDHNQQTCEHCGKVFENLAKLKTHIHRQHRTFFTCPIEGCNHQGRKRRRMALHFLRSKYHKTVPLEVKHRLIASIGIDPATVSKTSVY